MSILDKAITFLKGPEAPQQTNLGWGGTVGSHPGATLPFELKAVSQAVKDIRTWQYAEQVWMADEMPRTYALQLIHKEVRKDLRVTSQLNNRIGKTLKASFALKTPGGEPNKEATRTLMKSPVYRQMMRAILLSQWYGYSLGELAWKQNKKGELVLNFNPIPRTNVVPVEGKFYTDYMEDAAVDYRNLPEFGETILEFLGDNDEDEFRMGDFNKLVPFVLFKKFAISCWSELCEIYGIPPRILSTNTQDAKMLARAKTMMENMSAAAWAVIDSTEKLEFGDRINTTGDVFANFRNMCNDEMSLAISGAIVGQDTKNGSNAKETASQDMLIELVQADMARAEQMFNEICVPALEKMGLVPKGHILEFDEIEDLQQLWGRVKDISASHSLDQEWLNDKFSLKITGERQTATPAADPNKNLDAGSFFV